MKKLKKLLQLLGKAQMYLGVACMLLIVLSVTAGIVARKAFNSPLSWVEELCTFLFIYLAFFGASVAAMNKKHVSADFLTQHFQEKGQKILAIVQRVVILALLGCMVVSAVILIPKMGTHASTSLDIPKSLYYIPIAFSSLYMFFVYLTELTEAVQALAHHKEG